MASDRAAIEFLDVEERGVEGAGAARRAYHLVGPGMDVDVADRHHDGRTDAYGDGSRDRGGEHRGDFLRDGLDGGGRGDDGARPAGVAGARRGAAGRGVPVAAGGTVRDGGRGSAADGDG